jgi:two-component system cell cycle response regulator
LQTGSTIIGRDPDVAISLPDHSLSRQHARVTGAGGTYKIEDLGSTNGTFVDGARIAGSHTLEDGCRIHLGTRTVLHFRLYDAVELAAARESYALTVRDPLTGTYNRRYLHDRLGSEWAYCRRHCTPLSLLLLDIDHFKRINDLYGHDVGDQTIAAVARLAAEEGALIGRLGGEEFGMLIEGRHLGDGVRVAERLRAAIAALQLDTANGPLTLSCSFGVSEHKPRETIDDLLKRADVALYAAKTGGRNRVVAAGAVHGSEVALAS